MRLRQTCCHDAQHEGWWLMTPSNNAVSSLNPLPIILPHHKGPLRFPPLHPRLVCSMLDAYHHEGTLSSGYATWTFYLAWCNEHSDQWYQIQEVSSCFLSCWCIPSKGYQWLPSQESFREIWRDCSIPKPGALWHAVPSSQKGSEKKTYPGVCSLCTAMEKIVENRSTCTTLFSKTMS